MAPPSWRPAASLEALRLRARLLRAVRSFFAERGVLEVETPLLSAAAATDPHLASFATSWRGSPVYLQTSPEPAMKRLLAAGSGPIYQLGRAFRDGEAGRLHNPEFTMLEWYRPGWDHHRLMDEVEELVVEVLRAARREEPAPAERLTYREAFVRCAGVDPFADPVERLREAARAARRGGGGAGPAEPARLPDLGDDRDAWLDLLMVSVVQERLGRTERAGRSEGAGAPRLVFLHDFPESQAALARVRRPAPGSADEPAVAERFELFSDGLELANGFHELTDAAEQRRRFGRDLAVRRERGLPEVPVDERLLAALAAGMPEGSGVALGFDRLVMVALGVEDIAEVTAFPVDRA